MLIKLVLTYVDLKRLKYFGGFLKTNKNADNIFFLYLGIFIKTVLLYIIVSTLKMLDLFRRKLKRTNCEFS